MERCGIFETLFNKSYEKATLLKLRSWVKITSVLVSIWVHLRGKFEPNH